MFKNIELIKLLKQLVTKQHHVYTQFNTKHGKPITKSNVFHLKTWDVVGLGKTRPFTNFWDVFFQNWTYNNFKWLSKYPTLLRDASATVKDVPLENAQNMCSFWTAWFQFWRKQHHLRIDVLFFHNILNEQRIEWVELDRQKKITLKCKDTYLLCIVIASRAPLIRTSKSRMQHFVFECGFLF